MKKEITLIILAGGKSSRMGKPKGLLKHNHTFWILSQIETFIGTEVFIGLGHDYQLYQDAIPWLKEAVLNPIKFNGKNIQVAINPTPELGLFSNLQNVLKQINTNPEVLILPIDVPLINYKEQQKLLLTENKIVIPSFQNKKGHPVKLTPEVWKPFLPLDSKDETARLDLQIKKRNASEISIIETSDASCILNLNTPKDWRDYISD
jgi:CTP:molybdopterin cytidylyltransferase MocA